MRTFLSIAALVTSIGLILYVTTKVLTISTTYIVMLAGAVIGAFLSGWALSNTPLTEWISELNNKMNEFINNAKREYEAGKSTIQP